MTLFRHVDRIVTRFTFCKLDSTTEETTTYTTLPATSSPVPCTSLGQANLGEACGTATQTTHHCMADNSACVKSGSDRSCRCVKGYVRREKSQSCDPVPVDLVTNGVREYVWEVNANSSSGTIVGSIDLRDLAMYSGNMNSPEVIPSTLPVTANISSNRLVVSTSGTLGDTSQTLVFMVKVTAVIDFLVVTDVVFIRCAVKQPFTPPTINIFLVEGTRRNTIIAEGLATGYNFLPNQQYDFKLSWVTTNPDLFEVLPNSGTVRCSQDIRLNKIANSSTVSTEVDMILQTKLSLQSALPYTTVANIHVLIIRDVFDISIPEDPAIGYTVAHLSHAKSGSFDLRKNDDMNTYFFKLNPLTGYLTINNPPSYDNGNKEFSFSATFLDLHSTTNTSVVLNVHVTNYNNKQPKFSEQLYTAQIPAGSFSGTYVQLLNASDEDGDHLTYSITSGRSSEFSVENGLVRAETTLDKARFGDNFTLQVQVSDGAHADDTKLVVFLVAIDTEARTNLNHTFSESVYENTPIGSSVVSVSVPGYTNYEIYGKDVQLFRTANETGEIVVQQRIDRESMSSDNYEFTVVADRASANQCFKVVVGTLTITVLDINDQIPEFASRYYTGTVYENTGRVVDIEDDRNTKVQIRATDKDIGINALLTFSVQGTGSGSFNMNKLSAETARLEVTSPIDRESVSFYRLEIVVIDGDISSNTRNTATVSLNVTVLDENDNSPLFVSGFDVINVPENDATALSTRIPATDADVGVNAELTYAVVDGGFGNFQFDGEYLKLTRSLDRELNPTFNLTVEVQDKGSPPLKTRKQVSIIVEDKNDNSPKFNSTKDQMLPENSNCMTPFFTVAAEDDDEGENARLTFSIIQQRPDTKFVINANTGAVRCLEPLDYENVTQREYRLTLFVSDHGTPSLNSTAEIRIMLTDRNDNAPKFTKGEYIVNVSRHEARSAKPITVVKATDLDSGKAGEVRYQLTDNSSGRFRISSEGVIFTTQALTTGTYHLTVQASDEGSPPMTSTISVTIIVSDVSGSQITFSESNIYFNMVEETNYTSTPIGRVVANGNAQGVQIVYSLVEEFNREVFDISSGTGDIFAKRLFDREKDQDHKVLVQACDQSDTKVCDLAIVHVTVLDINDNRPIFTDDDNTVVVEIFEGSPIDFFVITVTANDKDAGNNGTVIYSLLESGLPFSIGPNGTIRVSGELDRERIPQYSISIQARDEGTPVSLSSTISMTVDIMDINDNAPVFGESNYTAKIPEGTEVNEVILSVSASDRDALKNGMVDYIRNVQEVNTSRPCPVILEEVRDGAVVKLTSRLDYETKTRYTCQLVVRDRPHDPDFLQGTAILTLEVLDQNDNAPEFVNAPYQANVSRDEDLGHVVLTGVKAVDKDSGLNGVVRFSLNDSTGNFEADPVTGDVRLRNTLRQISEDSLTIYLIATDQGKPQLQTETQVVIYISDNNTRPSFYQEEYSVSILEESISGQDKPLAQLKARDWDKGVEIPCVCNYSFVSIKPANAADAFTFETAGDGGTVKQKAGRTVDREVVGNTIVMVIQATDDGEPKKSTTARVVIAVNDINDNAPKFNQSSFGVTVLQDARPGTIMQRVTAVDIDEGDNAITRYEIDYVFGVSEDAVAVNATTGDLIVTGPLYKDSEETYNIEIILRAEDFNDTQMFSTTRVTIRAVFQSSNLHAPVFSQNLYSTNINFLSKKGEKIHIPDFGATDGDGDKIMFSIGAGNVRDILEIDSETGNLSLKYDLDDTIETPINLTLHATDYERLQFAKTSWCTVLIHLKDPEKIECLVSAELSQLRDERKIFTILFAICMALICGLVIGIIVIVYRWRVAANLPATKSHKYVDDEKDGKDGAGYSGLGPSEQSIRHSDYQTLSHGIQNPAFSSILNNAEETTELRETPENEGGYDRLSVATRQPDSGAGYSS